MTKTNLTDGQLASHLAEAAGEHLKLLRRHGLLDEKQVGKQGDQLANTFLTNMLRHYRPDDGLLSEEEVADPARLSKKRVWIIDPVDGTREYGEGRTDWAVHVGLSVDGIPSAASAVALPDLATVLSGMSPPPLPDTGKEQLKIVVSRTRAPRIAEQVAKHLNAQLIPMGSAGAKAMAVVRGEAHAYLHAGGQYEWDSCAPVGVATAAGFHASRIDGSPCRYNQADTSMPDLLICHPALAQQFLSAIACSLEKEVEHV